MNNKLTKNWQNIHRITTTVVLVGSAAMADGKIGDTADGCAKIYGEACETSSNGSKTVYRKGGIITTCYFVDGKCAAVSYEMLKASRVFHPSSSEDPRFTDDQEAALLNLNRQGSSWVQENKTSKFGLARDGTYKTVDGKLQALVNFVAVNIETAEFRAKRTAAIQKEELDKVIAVFGDGATVEPRPISGNAPLTAEEQKRKDQDDQMNKNLEDLRKSSEELGKSQAESDKALKDIAEHARLMAEWTTMESAGKDLVAKLNAIATVKGNAKTPEELKAATAEESRLVAATNELSARMKINGARRKELMAAGR